MPPVRPWLPWVWLASLLTALTFLVVVLVRPPGPLDQQVLADQRDGLLDSGPAVAASVAGVQFGGRVVVLVFERNAPSSRRLAAWRSTLAPEREVILVRPAPATEPLSGQVVVDPAGTLADAVDLPTPRDGGVGIGYAVIDASRVVRYATLDPSWLDNAFEVATIASTVS